MENSMLINGKFRCLDFTLCNAGLVTRYFETYIEHGELFQFLEVFMPCPMVLLNLLSLVRLSLK